MFKNESSYEKIRRLYWPGIEKIRKLYKPGTRVSLVEMDDCQAPPVGTRGTVLAVDDAGTIHVKWDNGSALGVIYGEDRVQIIGQGN